MKDPQQEVDELIEKYYQFVPVEFEEDFEIKCALIDNQNTIDALEDIPDLKVVGNVLLDRINHHTQIRTILKSRLK